VATLQQLIESTKELRKKFNKAKPCQLRKVFLVPMSNQIAVNARFDRTTDKFLYHEVLIIFKDISIDPERNEEHPVGFEVLPERWMYTERPSLTETDVGVVCSCSDYFYTWWKWNRGAKAYIGGLNMPPYQRKTAAPPVGRPYKNPSQKPGVCKHIAFTVQKLAETKWMRQ